jgi:hypothetical protein
VRAVEPLEIENKALGYRLSYQLLHFDNYRRSTFYSGTCRFEEMTPADNRQAERWERNRQKAYQGSIRHLMASLVAGTSKQEGFLIYEAPFNTPPDPSVPVTQLVGQRPTASVDLDSLIRPGKGLAERQLISPKPLEIFYTRKSMIGSPYRDLPYAYSVLSMRQGRAVITTDGWLEKPMGLAVSGDMGADRLANLLPADWKPVREQPIIQQTIAGELLSADSTLAALATDLMTHQRSRPPTVFLHIDKPVYMTGDTLWLSAYILDPATHQLRTVKNDEQNLPLHTELRTSTGNLIQHQLLKISNGRANGLFRLSDTLITGSYELRAYTRTDNTLGQPAFRRTISIVSGLSQPNKPTSLPDSSVKDRVDVQFLPEGGRWVAGLSTRLGIKAVDKRGLGKVVTGRIRSGQGDVISQFTTNQFGITHVTIKPLSGQDYLADVLNANSRVSYNLPPVDAQGLTLSADNVTDTTKLAIRVLASDQRVNTAVYLLVQNHAQIVGQFRLKLHDGQAELLLPMGEMKPGLLRITLFDGQGQAQAERIVYVPERFAPIDAGVTTNKLQYMPREPIAIALRIADSFGDPLTMDGSISITDAEQVPMDSVSDNMRTHLLMTGELRGLVENPGYYFRHRDQTARRDLDDLLLTQGWRRLIGLPAGPVAAKPGNPGGIRISGRVVDPGKRPMAGTALLLTFTGKSAVSFTRSARTDSDGLFQVEGLILEDTITVRVRVMDAAFRTIKASVLLDAPANSFPTDITAIIPDQGLVDRYTGRMHQRQAAGLGQYRDPTARQLNEVVVRAAKPDDDRAARQQSLHGSADATVLFDENSRSYPNLYEMMAGRVPGVIVRKKPLLEQGNLADGYQVTVHGVGTFEKNSQPLYLVDGSYVTENEEGNVLDMFNPNDVERIEVLKNSVAGIYGSRGGAGVIAIFLRRQNKSQRAAPGETTLTVYGYVAHREFYVPRYTVQSMPQNQLYDQRDVLYWKPIVATDSRGQTTLRFPLSDTVRTLRLTLQGVTTEGYPIFITKVISVK